MPSQTSTAYYIKNFEAEFVDPLQLYHQAHNIVFYPFEEKDKKWVHQTFSSTSDLYLYRELDNYNLLEAKVKHRVWNFLYTIHDGSSINVEIGEKSSKASATRRNSERRIEAEEPRQRKIMGYLSSIFRIYKS